MKTYTAHERDGQDGSLAERADAIVFVKEGIAWWALLFPEIWLIAKGMWLVLAAFLLFVFAVQGIVLALEWPEAIAGTIRFMACLLLALLGNDLRRWTLARKGYRFAGLASGRDRAECEQRFFEEWLQGKSEPVSPAPAEKPKPVETKPSPAARTGATADDVIGLFPEPGR